MSTAVPDSAVPQLLSTLEQLDPATTHQVRVYIVMLQDELQVFRNGSDSEKLAFYMRTVGQYIARSDVITEQSSGVLQRVATAQEHANELEIETQRLKAEENKLRKQELESGDKRWLALLGPQGLAAILLTNVASVITTLWASGAVKAATTVAPAVLP